MALQRGGAKIQKIGGIVRKRSLDKRTKYAKKELATISKYISKRLQVVTEIIAAQKNKTKYKTR